MITENKTAWSKLRNTMSNLDNSIPDTFFDNEDGQEIADSISAVWDAIAELERHYAKYHLVKKDSTTDET